MSSLFKVGLIGLGKIAAGYGSPDEAAPYCHAGGLRKAGRFELAGAADLFEGARQNFSAKWGEAFPGTRLFEDIASLLAAGPLDVVNAFDGWADYERMCGLIWRGKRGSGHGEFGPLQVEFTAPHPATQGMAPFQTEDELYHGMIEAPGAAFEVLATAFSDASRGGTGRDEPVILASSFGAGRVFHHLLGHLWKGDPDGAYRGASPVALENAGFCISLLRGCKWAGSC